MSTKGGNYERDISKKLSLWYTNNERDDIFWHTSGSGSRATTRMKNKIDTHNSCGDICYLDEIGKPLLDVCLIELKRGYSTGSPNEQFKLIDLIDKKVTKKKIKKPKIIRWIKKANKEAFDHNREHFLIIVRRDRKVSCIVIQNDTFELLKENNGKNWCFPHDGPIAHIGLYDYDFSIVRLEDFFYWCHPNSFNEKILSIKRRRYLQGKYAGLKIKDYPI